jgi:hypothetical protein
MTGKHFIFLFILLMTAFVLFFPLREQRMDLSQVRNDILTYIEALQVKDQPYGCYRLQPGGKPDFYATADAAIIRTIMAEDLQKTLTVQQRQQWTDIINSYAKVDGTYESRRHAVPHRNGTAIGALGVLGGKQKYPVCFYKEFDSIEKIEPWLEKIDYIRFWRGSHDFWGGMLFYGFSNVCPEQWRRQVFDWLDRNLDPETGWWRKGIQAADWSESLGGSAHLWPMYQHFNRPFPYPKQVIDSILEMQRRNGSWAQFGDCLNLDALYGFAYMRTMVPDYREKDVKNAIHRQGDYAIRKYRAFLKTNPDMHTLLAVVAELGLLNQLDPDRFFSAEKWSDIFSDRRLYQTAAVEILQ